MWCRTWCNPFQTWSSPPPSCRPALLRCTRTFSSGRKIDLAFKTSLLHFDKMLSISWVEYETYVRKTSRSSPTRPYPRRGDSCISQMALRRQPFPSIPKVNRKSSTYCAYGVLLYFLVSKFENFHFSEQTKFPKCTFRMQWSQKGSYCTQIAFKSESSWGQSTIKAEMAKTLYTFIAFVSFLLLRIQNQIFVLGQVAILYWPP